jgi:long-subunit fatty acid transport protein
MLRNYQAVTNEVVADQLNKATGNALGQLVTAELGYRFNNKLRLGIGIDYVRTHNTFRYVSIWDTIIPHPAFPTTESTSAIATRRVNHNNFQQFVAVPVVLEFNRSFGDLSLGLGAGVAFHYNLRSVGRTIDGNNSLVRFDETPGQTAGFQLSYRLRSSLAYALNDRLSVQGRIDFHYYDFGTSAYSGAQEKSLLTGGSIGLIYRLRP